MKRESKEGKLDLICIPSHFIILISRFFVEACRLASYPTLVEMGPSREKFIFLCSGLRLYFDCSWTIISKRDILHAGRLRRYGFSSYLRL